MESIGPSIGLFDSIAGHMVQCCLGQLSGKGGAIAYPVPEGRPEAMNGYVRITEMGQQVWHGHIAYEAFASRPRK